MASKKKLGQKSTNEVKIRPEQDDPAQEAGHKKMNLKVELGKSTGVKTRSQKLAGLEAVTRADNIRRKESPQRRITGDK